MAQAGWEWDRRASPRKDEYCMLHFTDGKSNVIWLNSSFSGPYAPPTLSCWHRTKPPYQNTDVSLSPLHRNGHWTLGTCLARATIQAHSLHVALCLLRAHDSMIKLRLRMDSILVLEWANLGALLARCRSNLLYTPMHTHKLTVIKPNFSVSNKF